MYPNCFLQQQKLFIEQTENSVLQPLVFGLYSKGHTVHANTTIKLQTEFGNMHYISLKPYFEKKIKRHIIKYLSVFP